MGRENEGTRIVALHAVNRPTYGAPAYRFREGGKLPWLQRLCFWVLDRIAPAEPVVTSTIHFEAAKIARVLEMVEDQFQTVVIATGRPPTRLLIGARNWRDMTKDPELPFHVEGDGPYRYTSYSSGIRDKVMRLHVEIVPWMRGIVVLP